MANRKRSQKTKGESASRKLRMTVARRVKATVRLIRGEPMKLVTRCFGVTAAAVSHWHEAFFEGVECAVEREKSDPEDKKIDQLQSLLDSTTMDNEIEARAGREDGGGSPFCAVEIEAISAVISFLYEKGLRLAGLGDQSLRCLS